MKKKKKHSQKKPKQTSEVLILGRRNSSFPDFTYFLSGYLGLVAVDAAGLRGTIVSRWWGSGCRSPPAVIVSSARSSGGAFVLMRSCAEASPAHFLNFFVITRAIFCVIDQLIKYVTSDAEYTC